jgi:hypothetical protein
MWGGGEMTMMARLNNNRRRFPPPAPAAAAAPAWRAPPSQIGLNHLSNSNDVQQQYMMNQLLLERELAAQQHELAQQQLLQREIALAQYNSQCSAGMMHAPSIVSPSMLPASTMQQQQQQQQQPTKIESDVADQSWLIDCLPLLSQQLPLGAFDSFDSGAGTPGLQSSSLSAAADRDALIWSDLSVPISSAEVAAGEYSSSNVIDMSPTTRTVDAIGNNNISSSSSSNVAVKPEWTAAAAASAAGAAAAELQQFSEERGRNFSDVSVSSIETDSIAKFKNSSSGGSTWSMRPPLPQPIRERSLRRKKRAPVVQDDSSDYDSSEDGASSRCSSNRRQSLHERSPVSQDSLHSTRLRTAAAVVGGQNMNDALLLSLSPLTVADSSPRGRQHSSGSATASATSTPKYYSGGSTVQYGPVYTAATARYQHSLLATGSYLFDEVYDFLTTGVYPGRLKSRKDVSSKRRDFRAAAARCEVFHGVLFEKVKGGGWQPNSISISTSAAAGTDSDDSAKEIAAAVADSGLAGAVRMVPCKADIQRIVQQHHEQTHGTVAAACAALRKLYRIDGLQEVVQAVTVDCPDCCCRKKFKL